jgi:hypothetical protein
MDANVNIGLNINGEGAINTVGSLKAQLRQAQAEVAALSDQFGATSVEAANAARKAADLADRIGDAKLLTDAFNPDAKFKSLSNSIGGVLNGFQAYQGALGLMGVDSKEFEQTLLKVQSAMALTQGINGVLEAKDAFKTLGAVVSNTFGTMTTASKVFAVSGIGLLITAVGYLISKWGEESEEAKKAAEEQKKLNEELKKQQDYISKESVSFVTLIARLKSTNQNSKERKDLIKEINKQYGTTLKNLKDEKDFQKQLNLEVDNYIKFKIAEYNLKANEDKIQYALGKRQKKQQELNEAQKNYNDVLKKYNENYAGITVMNVEYAREELVKKKKALDENSDALKFLGLKSQEASVEIDGLTNSGKKYVENSKSVNDATDDTADKLTDLSDQILSEQRKREDLQISTIQNEEARAKKQVETEAQRQLDDLKNTKATKEQKAQLEEEIKKTSEAKITQITQEFVDKRAKLEKDAADKARQYEADGINAYLDELELLSEENFQAGLTEQQREEQAVNDKYFRLLTMAGDNKEQLKIIEEAKGRELKEITDKYVKIDEETQRESLASKLQMASEAIGVLGSLFEGATAKNEREARKQFKINKAFSLSSAVVNTALAVTKSLPNPIAVALAAATGAIQIAKIASTQFGGWSPPDVPTPPPGPTDTTSQENAFTPSTFISLGKAQTGASANYGSTKVYVLESDITSVQNKVGVIESRSYLGG